MPVGDFFIHDKELTETGAFRSTTCARSRGYGRTTNTQSTRLVRNAALGGDLPIHYTYQA
jgi:hypothetical protein